MKTLLPSSVPNFISQDAIFQAALLRQECGSDGGFFVWLKLVRNLEDGRLMQKWEKEKALGVQIEEQRMIFRQQPRLCQKQMSVMTE
jgi:hypothetical protein